MLATPSVAKYSPPRLPAIIPRQRLIHRLQPDDEGHLALVIGQAAQGKSTLVADYLSTHEAPAAWLHLDPQDGDCANFYHLLVCALDYGIPDRGLDEYGQQAHIAMSTSAAAVRYEAMLRSIWQRLPAGFTVVLDGLEQLDDQAGAHALIRAMITLAADKGRLILVSRQLPPYKLQQSMMRRQVAVVDNEALAFTRKEIAVYFKTVHGFELNPACTDDLANITGGWTGGLVLLSQALARQPADRWQAFLTERLPLSLAGEAWRYFAEEIFDEQPGRIQDFLMKAALVEEIDTDLLSPLFEEVDAAAVLEDLVERHLFIQMVHDTQQRPLYRFNHLFQGFLSSQFEKRHNRREKYRIYEQIAERYLQRRQAEVAAGYYIKSENMPAAARSIKKVGMDLVIRGRFADLEAALTALPAEQISADPWLLLLLTLTRRVKGGVRNIRDFRSAMEAFERRKDIRGHLLAMAYLIEAYVFTGHDPVACHAWIKKAETLLAAHAETHLFTFARTLLWLQIGFGYIACGLDLTKGISACRSAYLLAHKIGDRRLMANANIVSVLGLALRGEFSRADEALDKISSFTDTDAYTEYHILRSLVNAQLALHRGDLTSVRKQLVRLAAEIETFGMLFLYPAYVDILGFVQIFQGDYNAARDTCRHLLDVAILSGNTYYEGLSQRLTAMRHYFQTHYFDAMAAADNALAMLSRGQNATLHAMRAQQLAGLISMHNHRFKRARDNLIKCRQYFSETANLLSLSETHLSLALLAHARGKAQETTRRLSLGFHIAAERQFDHFIVLSPADLKTCCRLALDCLPKAERLWPEHLLLARFSTRTVQPRTASEAAGAQKTSKLSDSSPHPSRKAPGFLDIKTFGGFRVLRNGRTPIEDNHWGGNRTKSLLKAIVVHGMHDIPKDILVEDLWPESKPGSASQNFKVTLHRLRKTLEPKMEKHGRSAFIHLKDNLVSLDKNRCRVDVQVFLTCCKDIKRACLTKETEAVLVLGQQVMDLYHGDFLPEDPYAPWAEMKRLALRDEYIATMNLMSGIYERQDRPDEAARCCRAAIAADACLEEANARLMRVYVRQGRKSDAVKVFEQLKANLENELGVDPDPTITEFYHSIRKQRMN